MAPAYEALPRRAPVTCAVYTWSPANLGNLFRACGFAVVESKPLIFRWPPKSRLVQKLIGWHGFHAASRLWGFLYWPAMQTRLVARKA